MKFFNLFIKLHNFLFVAYEHYIQDHPLIGFITAKFALVGSVLLSFVDFANIDVIVKYVTHLVQLLIVIFGAFTAYLTYKGTKNKYKNNNNEPN